MPLLKLETSADLSPEQKDQLLTDLSKTVSDVTGKPETYVMVTIQSSSIAMGGTAGPAAFADIRGIGGLDPATNKNLSEAVCSLLSESLDIAGDRIYLNFTDIAGSNWGWNSGTF